MNDMYAQVIFNGKTAASLPAGPVPEGLTVTCTESHWSSTTTVLDLVKFLDDKMIEEAGEHVRWVMVLESASTRGSQTIRAASGASAG